MSLKNETDVEDKLKKLGLSLPEVPRPAGNYLPAKRFDQLLYISGVTCKFNGNLEYKGQVGNKISVEEAYEGAQICTLNHLAIIKHVLGGFDCIDSVIRLGGYVNCSPDFTDIPQVINGASDLLIHLFGERGLHARCAVGVRSLPGSASVETDLLIGIKDNIVSGSDKSIR